MTSFKQFLHTSPVSPAAVILATPLARDLQYLRRIAADHQLHAAVATTYRDVLAAMARERAMAIICDESLPWRDFLSYLAEDCAPPRVIVVCSQALNSLWAEVLNLGGFDVLTKPFEDTEVARILTLACARYPQSVPERRRPEQATPRLSLAKGA